jgi:hypothetical protein
MLTRRTFIALTAASTSALAQTAKPAKPKVIATPPPTGLGLVTADITKLAPETDQLDLYLLIGQSNMKGRGVMPETAASNPRILAMHLKDDQWYVARHPLHLTGNAQTFVGHDNAGVGPGLAFAEAIATAHPRSTIGLIPCAVGGSQIKLWQRGAKLYDEAMRRAKLTLQTTAPLKGRIRAALWLQGESDARPAELAVYEAKLLKLVDDLRSDLDSPELPFIACTIGEMGDAAKLDGKAGINQILLSLSQKRPHTACIDCRDLKTHIGDSVHFDTVAQNIIGQRYAETLLKLP